MTAVLSGRGSATGCGVFPAAKAAAASPRNCSNVNGSLEDLVGFVAPANRAGLLSVVGSETEMSNGGWVVSAMACWTSGKMSDQTTAALTWASVKICRISGG